MLQSPSTLAGPGTSVLEGFQEFSGKERSLDQGRGRGERGEMKKWRMKEGGKEQGGKGSDGRRREGWREKAEREGTGSQEQTDSWLMFPEQLPGRGCGSRRGGLRAPLHLH